MNMTKKRLVSWLTTLCMVMGMLPATSLIAYAAEIPYNIWIGGKQLDSSMIDANGVVNKDIVTGITSGTVTFIPGNPDEGIADKLVLDNAELYGGSLAATGEEYLKDAQAGIYASGDLELVLKGISTVNSSADMTTPAYGQFDAVSVENNMSINGDGTLVAQGRALDAPSQAGNGSRSCSVGAKGLVISGGTVWATGGKGKGMPTNEYFMCESHGIMANYITISGINTHVIATGGAIEDPGLGGNSSGIYAVETLTVENGTVQGISDAAAFSYGVCAEGPDPDSVALTIKDGEVTGNGGVPTIMGAGIMGSSAEISGGLVVATIAGEIVAPGDEEGPVGAMLVAPDLKDYSGAPVVAGMDITGKDAVAVANPTMETYMGNKYIRIGTSTPKTQYTVKFDSKGGSTVEDQKVEDGGKITPPADPTRDSYEFVGWYYNNKKWDFAQDTVKGNMTLTAKWGVKLSGNITATDYSSIDSIKLIDMEGNEFSGKVKGNASPFSYTVAAPESSYNLVVTGKKTIGSDSKTITKTELADFSSKTQDVIMPSGAYNSIVDKTSAGEYAGTLVGGLSDLAIGNANEVVEVKLAVSNTVADSEKTEVAKTAAGKKLDYMDLTLTKTVDGNPITDFGSTNDKLIQIVVPYETAGKYNLTVYRDHNGTVDTLTVSSDTNAERIKVDAHSVTIFAKKFSTYAIGYTTDNGGGGGGRGSHSSGSVLYPVNPPSNVDNGSITIKTKNASKGEIVTIIVAPKDGYALNKLVVTDKNGEKIKVTDKGNGEYTFVMPDSKVDVAASFIAAEHESIADPTVTCVAQWLNTKDHIAYLSGYDNGSFGPADNMTRAQAAQMFYNLLNNKNVKGTAGFADVPKGAWYEAAVNTLADLGIMSGVGDSSFAPNRPITRAEFTATAMRFAKLDDSGKNIFTDVSEKSWYYRQVKGAVKYGWISGYTDGTFKPNATITRAEVASIVNRMLARSADQDYVDSHAEQLHQFSDVAKSNWAYYHIMEAVNAHDYTKTQGVEDWTSLK